jgi:hypothetical protein
MIPTSSPLFAYKLQPLRIFIPGRYPATKSFAETSGALVIDSKA